MVCRVVVVFPNDLPARTITDLTELAKYAHELTSLLNVPKDYRVISDGMELYLENGGSITFIGAPFSGCGVVYHDHVLSALNGKIECIMSILNEQKPIKRYN